MYKPFTKINIETCLSKEREEGYEPEASVKFYIPVCGKEALTHQSVIIEEPLFKDDIHEDYYEIIAKVRIKKENK